MFALGIGIPSKGRVKCLYIGERVNPSSMDGVPDLRDQISLNLNLSRDRQTDGHTLH